jgi:phage gp36-like protein
MAYATVADMVLRWGEAEMIRASTPDGAAAVAVVAEPINVALENASAMIDGYLRKRYRVPLEAIPPEINDACCKIARYEVNTGGDKAPSEQTVKGRDDAVVWLARIARGEVVLGMEEVTQGDESFATTRARRPVFGGHDGFADGCGHEGFGFWEGDLP